MAEMVHGLLLGTVVAVDAKAGAIKAKLHDRGINTHWAPIAAAMSGNGRGAYFMPEIDDEVVLGFDRGRFDHPYVVGFLWNGPDKPPRTDARMRVLRSVNGHEIVFYDPPVTGGDRGYIRITDGHGNQIELANGRITITGKGAVQINAPMVSINNRIVSPVGPPI